MKKVTIFDQMKSDHREVLARLASLEAVAREAEQHVRGRGRGWPGPEVAETLRILERQFATHMAAEDEVLFPALLEALPQTRLSIEPLKADHAELRTMLERIQETMQETPSAARDEQIGVQLRDLVDLLRIHLRKEEALVISVAERVLQPREVEALAARRSSGEPQGATKSPRSGPSKGARS
jgi:hemerythrin-like domain-containing protein